MIVDEDHENYEEMKLYNDVMGIALAVWNNAGETAIFRFIDKALDNFNVDQMNTVKDAFDMLPETLQGNIMADNSSENTIAAMDRFSRYISQMGASRKVQMA